MILLNEDETQGILQIHSMSVHIPLISNQKLQA